MNDNCKGCFVITETCQIVKKGYQDGCPCSTCIVKITCKQSCDTFTNFDHDVVYHRDPLEGSELYNER